MQDELSKLYKLTAPYFPGIGEVFVAVSAGNYRGRGFPMFFSEFFIFSTKDKDEAIGRRSYLQHPFTVTEEGKTGLEYLLDITKTRALAELTNEISKRIGLDEKAVFFQTPCLTESNWDVVQDLFRAGLFHEDVLSKMADRTRAGTVAQATRSIRYERRLSFEDAKDAE